MVDDSMDINRELMLDGNAVAGVLYEIFGREMTLVPAKCAHCGNVTEMGALWTFGKDMGIVMRCPACENVLIRIVETLDKTYIEARGVEAICLSRSDL